MDSEEIGVSLRILEHGQEENNNLIRDMSSRYEEHLILGRLFQTKTEEELEEMKEVVDWVKEKRITEKDKKDFYKDLKKRLATAGILGAIGLLGSIIWFAIKSFIKGGGVT